MSWWTRYVGIPFSPHGRGPDSYDCWGLVRAVYIEQLSKNLPAWDAYESLKDCSSIRELLGEAINSFRKVERPCEYAIALFKSEKNVFHVGVLIDEQRMLHTAAGKDACVENWNKLERQLNGFYVPYDQDHRQD